MWWLISILLAFVLPFYARLWLRDVVGPRRLMLLIGGLALTASLPFFIASTLPGVRFIVAMISVLYGFRLAEVAFGRFPDPQMQTTLPRFLAYFVFPTDASWCQTIDQRQAARRAGLRRMLRGMGKGLGVIILLLINAAWAGSWEMMPIRLFWLIYFCYFLFTGTFDLGSGLDMLTGIKLMETFRAPLLAASPRDFWSRRWNLAFRNFVHRLVFQPLRGHQYPIRGVLIAFLLSAVVHEYIVIASLGRTRGHMTVFFTLHGLVTLADGLVNKARHGKPVMPRWVAIAVHQLWLALSGAIFFPPMLQAFPFGRVPWSL